MDKNNVALLVLLVSVALASPAPAAAQGLLPADERQDAELAAGETHEWTLELQRGQWVDLTAASEGDLVLEILPPTGEPGWKVDSDSIGIESGQWQAESDGSWRVVVSEFQQVPASYWLEWSPSDQGAWAEEGFAEGAFEEEIFDEGASYEGEAEPVPQGSELEDGEYLEEPPQQGDMAGRPDAGLGQAILEVGAKLLSRTVLPFLMLLAMQGLTVFFVLRFMMRPSQAAAAEEEAPAATEEAAARGPGAGELAFLEAGTANGIVLTGDSYARYRHSLEAAKRMLWAFLRALVGFLLLSAALVAIVVRPWELEAEISQVSGGDFSAIGPRIAPVVVLIVQAVLAVMFFFGSVGLYTSSGNPLRTGYAVLTAGALLVPALSAIYFGSFLALALWLLLVVLLWRAMRKGGRRAGEFGKQDLLVLRVFGADASAVTTFGTLARSWRYLGPTVTIADPSFVRYEYSATNKGNRWKTIIITFLIGLGSLSSPEVFVPLAIVVVLLLVVLPIFISVWRKFIKDREKLLRKIGKTMGGKMDRIGVYDLRPYYCYDDLWRPAVQQMMKQAEVVLMDFRGFDPTNLGCEYEIGKMLDSVPIHRVVLLLDENTDHEGIYKIFRDRWADLAQDSPGRQTVEPTLKVFTAHPLISWRDGIWKWLRSLWRREKRWREDAERILAFIATAPTEHGFKAIR